MRREDRYRTPGDLLPLDQGLYLCPRCERGLRYVRLELQSWDDVGDVCNYTGEFYRLSDYCFPCTKLVALEEQADAEAEKVRTIIDKQRGQYAFALVKQYASLSDVRKHIRLIARHVPDVLVVWRLLKGDAYVDDLLQIGSNERNRKIAAMTANLSPEEREQIASLERWRAVCNKLYKAGLLPEPTELDHDIPIMGDTVTGLHHPRNLQPMFRSQNISKGKRYAGRDGWGEMRAAGIEDDPSED